MTDLRQFHKVIRIFEGDNVDLQTAYEKRQNFWINLHPVHFNRETVGNQYFNFMDDNMGPWKIRQVQTSIVYLTADLLGYGILDGCPHHLQIDQLRHDHHDDDDEGNKNQQAFDQPAINNYIRFSHDGFS